MSYLLPQIENWDQWSRIFTDLDLWKPVVSAICSTERIAYSNIETGYPGTNAVFILDRRYVVKIYNPVWHDFGPEHEVHVRLIRDGQVPVPEIVSWGTFEDRTGWDYLITEFVDGTPLRELRDSIGPTNLVRISSELGEIVRAFHDTDLEGLGMVEERGESTSELVLRKQTELVKDIRDRSLLPDDVIDELTSFLVSTAAEAKKQRPLLVHGDLTEDHLLLRDRGGCPEIAVLIDFGDAHLHPPEYEWPPLWLDLLQRDRGALRAFFDTYDPALLEDDDFTKRAFVWTLFHDFGTGMVEDAVKRNGGARVGSVDDLRQLLWPRELFTA